jgi:transporter family-2 protein
MRARLLAPLLGLVAGVALSVQSFANGRLGQHFGSPELAAVVNSGVSVIAGLVVGAFTGALVRARRQYLEARERPRWWHFAMSLNGVVVMLVAVHAAPRIGITRLTVAMVCGQTVGSLLLDRLGLSTAGRHDMTPVRLAGVSLAIAAVIVGAFGTHGELHPGLLLLAVLAGALFGFIPSGMSHVARATGEPLVAGLVQSSISGAGVLVVALAATGASPPSGWSAPASFWVTGGLCGMAGGIALVVAVKALGILRLALLGITGQSIGALALDLIAPPADGGVTATTFISLIGVFAAVAVSSRSPTRKMHL